MDPITELRCLIKANPGVLAVETQEIPRFTDILVREFPDVPMFTLGGSGGLKRITMRRDRDDQPVIATDVVDAAAKIVTEPTVQRAIQTCFQTLKPDVARDRKAPPPRSILILRQVNFKLEWLQTMLQDAVKDAINLSVLIVLVGKSLDQSTMGDLFDYCGHFSLPLAGEDELGVAFDVVAPPPGVPEPTAEVRSRVIATLRGLPLQRAEDAVAQAYAKASETPNVPLYDLTLQEKIALLPKQLKVMPRRRWEDIGGLSVLKESVENEMLLAWGTEDAVNSVLAVGVQGTGKSLFCGAIADKLQMVLLQLCLSDLEEGVVGGTAKRVNEVIDAIIAFGPHVLWFDEGGDALGSAESAHRSGSTMAQVSGKLATFWDNLPPGVVIVMTANEYERIPLKIRRRFAMQFFMDLPTSPERPDIARVHLAKRGVTGDALVELSQHVGDLTKGYSGSEIEQVVISAARRTQRNFTKEALTEAVQRTVPMSVSAPDEVAAVRQLAKRMRCANTPEPEDDTPTAAPSPRKRSVGRG